jgi:hypothetical protein
MHDPGKVGGASAADGHPVTALQQIARDPEPGIGPGVEDEHDWACGILCFVDHDIHLTAPTLVGDVR